MNGSQIGGGAHDYFVSRPHKTWKAKKLSVYQALSLMIAFALLVLKLHDKNNKKW